VSLVVDFATDWAFRSIGLGPRAAVEGFFQTLIIYTIGSEAMLSLSTALIVETTDDAMSQLIAWLFIMTYHMARLMEFFKALMLFPRILLGKATREEIESVRDQADRKGGGKGSGGRSQSGYQQSGKSGGNSGSGNSGNGGGSSSKNRIRGINPEAIDF